MTHHHVKLGDSVQLGIPPPLAAATPADVSSFLITRGWQEYGDELDQWRHESKQRTNMTWEQAIAIEFYEFITLGGK